MMHDVAELMLHYRLVVFRAALGPPSLGASSHDQTEITANYTFLTHSSKCVWRSVQIILSDGSEVITAM